MREWKYRQGQNVRVENARVPIEYLHDTAGVEVKSKELL